MKQLIFALLFFGFTKITFSQTGTIIMSVHGIDVKKGGVLSTGIFDQKNFPKVGKALFEIRKDVFGNAMEITFENIPAGEYGVASFQDIDKDKDLKTNFLGFPTEPIGFSNDARIKMGPPSFEDARLKLESGKVLKITIQLH
jgi:uncharacterized protein (DUF2141 family)